MSKKSILLVLLVTITWGINFVVIKIGLKGMPPFLLAGFRYLFVALPLVFFIPKPKVPVYWALMYAMTISFGQFAFLFYGIKMGMPSGQASLVIQMNVFFTAFLCIFIYKEKVGIFQLIAGALSLFGLYLLSMGGVVGSTSTIGFVLTLCAAFSWALGNIANRAIARNYKDVSILSLVVWSALIPIAPFFICSFLFEPHDEIKSAIINVNSTTIFALIYLSFIATLLAYTIWGRLIAEYGTQKVVPFALFVPITGLLSGWIILGESLSNLQLLGCLILIIGLLLYVMNDKIMLCVNKHLMKKSN